jgi:hypothetical protein
MKKHILFATFLFGLTILLSCESKKEKPKIDPDVLQKQIKAMDVRLPKFTIDATKLEGELKQLGEFENARIDSKTNTWTKDKSKDYVLSVQLVDGKNLPQQDSALRELGKKAMILVIKSLKNKSDYNLFKVEFVTTGHVGAIRTSSTHPFVYKLDELE